MTKPKNTGLIEDGVITEEALLAYAEGKLSPVEQAEMERLLRDDPFAQEALEGMRKSSKPSEIHHALTSINSQLREKTGIRERNKKGIQIHWANYAYAALVLGVLVGVAFVMIHIFSNKQKEQMAKATDSVPVIEEKKKEEPKVDSARLIAEAALKDSLAHKADSIAAIATQNSSQGDQKTAAPTIDNTGSSNGDVSAQLAVAKAFFDANGYGNAEKKYDDILAKQPDNIEALYFGGICNYINGTKALGEANFDRLMKGGVYMDGAKWYKALILIRNGKKDQAKPILKDLTITGGYFKDRATKQYQDLFGK